VLTSLPVLQFEQMTGGRFNLTGDIASIRTQFFGLFNNMKSLLPPPSNAVEAVDITLPDSGIAVRIYSPAENGETLLPAAL
jgi:versiconal hemiacetal acetate esterase